jgi:Family of unknown function (DUF5681)
MTIPEKTGGQQAGRFQKGTSGNPNGRPKGSRNATTLMCEAMLDGQAQALTQTLIEMALARDPTALKLCVERILPRRDRVAQFELPALNDARDASGFLAAVAAAVASGEITPSEAEAVAKVVGHFVKAAEAAEAERALDRSRYLASLTDEQLKQIIVDASLATIDLQPVRTSSLPHRSNP